MRKLIFSLFFISGVCGLSYEVLWTRYLAIILGGTQISFACVLSVFMLGLATGSFFIGRIMFLGPNPLVVYGALEAGIGIHALIFPIFFRGLEYMVGSVTTLDAKFQVAFASIFIPTLLMGGTLPCISLISRSGRVGRDVGLLYGLNTLGAVIGILLTGFILVEKIGLDTSIRALGLLNIVVGAFAVALSGTARRLFMLREEKRRREFWIPFAIFFAFTSGITSFGYEVAYLRIFELILGSSTYSISIVLVNFILGIAVGSIFWATYFERRDTKTTFAIIQILCAVWVLVSIYLVDRAPWWNAKFSLVFARSETSFPLVLLGRALMCSIFVFPQAFLLGMVFPILTKAIGQKDTISGDIGTLFSVNSLGNMIGAIIGIFVLVDTLGSRNALIVLASINAFLSIVAKPIFTGFLVLLAVLGFFAPRWTPEFLALGAWRITGVKSWEEFKNFRKKRYKVIFFDEDKDGTCAVIASGNELILTVNGKPEATRFGDLRTEVLSGHIGMLLAPRIDNLLMIGLGSGITLGSVLRYPVKSAEVVELLPCVVEAASRYFGKDSGFALKDKRVKLIIDDAQSYIRRTMKSYDIIISEPSNPWMKASSNLFTVEFFKELRKILSEDGVLIQWFHTYEMTEDVLKMVFKTFLEIFPQTWVFAPQSGDLILAGFKGKICAGCLIKRFNFGKDDLSRIRALSPYVIPFAEVFSPSSLSDWLGFELIPVNSRYHPYLEFLAPRALWVGSEVVLSGGYKTLLAKLPKPSPHDLILTSEYFLEVSRELFCRLFISGLEKYKGYKVLLNDFSRLCLPRAVSGKPKFIFKLKDELRNLFPPFQ